MSITISGYQVKEELFRSSRTVIYRARRVIIKTLNNNYPVNYETTVNVRLGEI
ncbi:MAG: hypothetical protein GY934_11805 [Gammaproteobacteria bacterium]|nr:hypothetical protein [Gammaproteobacteria bacterium]